MTCKVFGKTVVFAHDDLGILRECGYVAGDDFGKFMELMLQWDSVYSLNDSDPPQVWHQICINAIKHYLNTI